MVTIRYHVFSFIVLADKYIPNTNGDTGEKLIYYHDSAKTGTAKKGFLTHSSLKPFSHSMLYIILSAIRLLYQRCKSYMERLKQLLSWHIEDHLHYMHIFDFLVFKILAHSKNNGKGPSPDFMYLK